MAVPLSNEDTHTLARVAETVHRMRLESDQANREMTDLEQANEVTLRSIVEDRDGQTTRRLAALGLLLRRLRGRPDALASLLMSLWDDPDEQVAETARRSLPATDPEVTAWLRSRLDDPDPARWSEAAATLARHGDRSIIPLLRGWFDRGDTSHRIVAWACLCFYGLLDRDESLALLRDAWAAGGRDDTDRTMLAEGLLQRGDRSGWDFLVDLARRADHMTSVQAAETIGRADWAAGRELMLHILDHASEFWVRWGMVERIARLGDLPHCWTADGPAEARVWLETQDTRPKLAPSPFPAPSPA